MESVPPLSAVVVQVASQMLATWVRGWVPQLAMVTPLELKETVPLPSVGVTVAVKVTDWPNVDGLSDEAPNDVPVAVRGEPAATPTPWKWTLLQSAVKSESTVVKQPV
jgi:hypothetical protein